MFPPIDKIPSSMSRGTFLPEHRIRALYPNLLQKVINYLQNLLLAGKELIA